MALERGERQVCRVVRVPSREQEDAVARLEEAMGGSDPRAGLFA